MPATTSCRKGSPTQPPRRTRRRSRTRRSGSPGSAPRRRAPPRPRPPASPRSGSASPSRSGRRTSSAARDGGARRSQSDRPDGARPAWLDGRGRFLRDRVGNVGCARAGHGGAPGERARAARHRTASRGRPGAGTVGAARLRGFRGARFSSGIAGVLSARAPVGRRPGARGGRTRGRVERMTVMRRLGGIVAALVLFGAAPLVAQCLYCFGKNKVQYQAFDFHIIQTEHFEVYYYPAERSAALDGARIAERWYARLSRVLHHQFQGRKPIIFYASQSDFQQTNIVDATGEGLGGVTEFFKHRMVLPLTGAYEELAHVVGHEMVHQFPYCVL